MISAPASYGQLIATRYRNCANPFANDVSLAIPTSGKASEIPQPDLSFIAGRVSMCHELDGDVRDAHGRLDETRIPHGREAAVDELLAGTLSPCPERRFSVVITHDVDRTTMCEYTAIAALIRDTRFRNLPGMIRSLSICGPAISRAIDKLLRFEADNQIRSIFFFLSGPYSLTRYGSRTSARWASAQSIIHEVKAAGMEIGLHGSYYAMDNGAYSDECVRLSDAAQSYIRHHRNHYLRYDPRRFWKQLSDAGITFDHSVGFKTRWGLRTGTCVPYPVYDVSAHALSGIIEVPMLLMDDTWALQFDRTDMNRIRMLLETVRRHRGCVGINFHPEALATHRAVWDCFRHVIGICLELGADMAFS